MSEKSGAKKWVMAIYAIVIVVALIAVCFQIYRISVGAVPSAIPINNMKDVKAPKVEQSAPASKLSDSPNVQEILVGQPVSYAALNGDDSRVTFRSNGGELICTIAKKLEVNEPKLLPLTVDKEGKTAKGEGVICASVHNAYGDKAIIGKCSGAVAHSVIGMWGDQISLGACINGRTPLTQDAFVHMKDNSSGERFKFMPLGIDQYTRLGNYACVMGSKGVKCANLLNGKGFTYSDSFGYTVF